MIPSSLSYKITKSCYDFSLLFWHGQKGGGLIVYRVAQIFLYAL